MCAAARHRGRDITAYNLGIRGDSSADIASRWREEAVRRLPAGVDGRLVFSFGVNDCVQGLPLADSLHRSAESLSQARAGWPVLMIGPPPIDDDIANAAIAVLSAALDRLCRDLGIAYLPLFAPLSADESWRREIAAGDGAHPGTAGYQRIANLVQAWPSWLVWVTS